MSWELEYYNKALQDQILALSADLQARYIHLADRMEKQGANLMLSHKKLREKMLTNPEVRAAYKSQEEEFALFDEIVRARKRSNLTQSQIAERMGTRVSAISRLE